nr:MAG TPA: Minor structural protein 4 [Caudoviricetes sp.]
MELVIYGRDGNIKKKVSPDSSSRWSEEVASEFVVNVNFTTWEFFILSVGDYIEVGGKRFSIKKEARPKKTNTQKYTYNISFYGREHDMQDLLFCRLNQGSDDLESVFAYDGTPMEYLQKLVDNMNRNADGVTWRVGEAISANRQTINFNGLYCWDAAAEIAAAFETEWWLDGEYLNLSKCERGQRVTLGYMKGLKTGLTQTENSDSIKWFTRLIPVGSTKNIDPSKYGFTHLQLPSRATHIDLNTQLGLKEHREEKAFSGIFPHRLGTISSVRSKEETNEETGDYTVYYVKDNNLPFNPDDYMVSGKVIHITFESGDLSGREFECNWHNDTKEFEIINTYPDENTQIPGGNLIPKAGDTYILTNIRMPDEYYPIAEQQFKQAVENYLKEYSRDISIYSSDTDYIYVDKHAVPLLLGQRVRLEDEQYFDKGYIDTRITRVERKLTNICEASIDCSAAISTSWKSSVDSSLGNLQYVLGKQEAQSNLQVLKTGDSQEPSEYNVFSALRSVLEMSVRSLSRKYDDTAFGIITFVKGFVSNAVSAFMKGAKFGNFVAGKDGSGGAISVDETTNRTSLEMDEGLFRDKVESALVNSDKVTTLNLVVEELAKMYDLTVSHVATLMGTIVKDYVSSEKFVSGFAGEGMKLYKAIDGSWNMELDNLVVRKLFTVFQLVVQKIVHQGGMVIRSAAGGKITKVTDGGTYWRCEHDSTDDFVEDDQLICQAFTGKSAKRYWRLVVSAGAGYFDLSKTDCERGSATPEEGDDVAVLGNRTDTSRQKAQIDCAIGDNAPYRDDYAGINSYSLAGKLITRTGELSGITDSVFGVLSGSGLYGTNVYLRGMFVLRSGKTVEGEIAGAIDDIEIGGRNLILNSKEIEIAATTGNYNYRNVYVFKETGEYTFSAELELSGTSRTQATALVYNNGNSGRLHEFTFDTQARKSVTFKLNIANPNIWLLLYAGISGTTAGVGAKWKNVKLEKGNKATDWTPAPEDVENRITTVETNFEIREGQISSKVTEATVAASNAKKSETSAAGSASTATAKAGEASTAATNATNKANDAASSASAAAGSASSAAASLQAVTVKESSINQTASNITLQVSEVTTKAGQASAAAELAMAMSQGRMLYRDASFASGLNGISVYNNAANGKVTISRVSGVAGNPNSSGYCIKITSTGAASPGYGGFTFSTPAKVNRVLVARFIANIPTGYTLNFATNSLGNGSTSKWLTDHVGTGKWTEYAYKVIYGSSGSFGITMYFYLSGGATPTDANPLIWYLCYATVFDVTDAEVDYIADAASKYTTKTTYEAGIKVLSDSIALKVDSSTFNALGNRVSAAESAITVAQNAIEQRVTKTEYNKVGRLVAYGTNTDALATSYVMLNDKQITHAGRGFTLFKINRTTLEFARVGTYDVYAGGANFTNFVNALNAIDANYVVAVISSDAIAIDTATANALANYGGSGMTCTATRRSYVLIGQKGIGKGNGLEQWKQGGAGNVTISTTIINGAVTGFFGGGNFATALSTAETRISQTENSINLKADKTTVEGINTRLQSAEAKITPDAIKLTVKEQTESIAASAAKRTELWVDATSLDVNKYYPITIPLHTTAPYTITVERTLNANYGKPSWSTHAGGFSVMCRWRSNGNGWGTIAIQRTILEYDYQFSTVIPVGSIGQVSTNSMEYVYVRGGSKYHVIVEGASGLNIVLRTEPYYGGGGQSIDIKTEVTRPQVDLLQRPTTDTIKSQITLDGFGISVFGKKIDFTGQVTFNSLNSALQSTINDKASNSQLTTLRNSLKDMAYQDMVTLAKLDTTIIDGGHIKTSLIDANAIVTGALVADRISTTDITTGRLHVTSGAKIGEWDVTATGLAITSQNDANILLNMSGTKFLRINENKYSSLISARNDSGSIFSLSVYGSGNGLDIVANGGEKNYGYAIKSAGQHQFYQRSGDIWNAPGVLWAGIIDGNGNISRSWGNGCTVSRTYRNGAGDYVIEHNAGSEYIPIATAIHGVWSIASVSDVNHNYFHVRTFHKDGNYGDSWSCVAIIGRNRI